MTTDTTTPSYTLEGLLEWLSWYQGMSVTHKIDILTVDLVVQLVDTMRDLAAAKGQIEALKAEQPSAKLYEAEVAQITKPLIDRIDALKAEAERYRYLRGWWFELPSLKSDPIHRVADEESLDAAIDSAIAQGK